jgi:hypothetical protein
MERMRMRTVLGAFFLVFLSSTSASAQSLFVLQGERAAEGSFSWSSGPFSNGGEFQGAVSLDGRWDVGFGYNVYSVDLGGDDNSTFTEWTPFVRYFAFKEDDDATPVSVAAQAQFFSDNFDGPDTGWYLLVGAQVFKKFSLTDAIAIHPFVGFSLVTESATLGGETDADSYLTRQFGVHTQFAVSDNGWVRLTFDEHAFRRESYRAARLAFVQRF